MGDDDDDTTAGDSISDLMNQLTDGFEEPWGALVRLLVLVVAAVLVYAVVRPLLLRLARTTVKRTRFSADDDLFGFGVFRWLTHFMPAVLIHWLAPEFFPGSPKLSAVLVAVSRIYMVVAGFFVVDSLINAGHARFQRSEPARRFPGSIFVQVAKLIAALVALILILAILVGQSPLVLLGGLGVFASVLMLVFRDTILGFVAGIQIATNEMLAPGDWLEMPSHGADGSVLEIGLITVKVQNWDKTISTIPTHALISNSFRNWRGMKESGGRRIKRALFIDLNTIRLCDQTTIQRFREIESIAGYLERKENEVGAWNRERGVADENRDANRVNARRLTNVGTFRAYIEAYLRNHPEIRQDLTLLVRQLAPTDAGLPIEIYCFTNTTGWKEYERIQADIFDHLLAVAREFDLKVFQKPSGEDVRESVVVVRNR